MVRITSGCGALLLLLACGDDAVPAAPQDGQPAGGGGGKPSISSSGSGGAMQDDAGVAGGPSDKAQCPPIGRFRRTSVSLDPTSDPRCELTAGTTTRFFGPITQSHQIVNQGVSCTFKADDVSADMCKQRRVLTCADGSMLDTNCELSQTDSIMRCRQQNDATSARCIVLTEYTIDQAWSGPCNPIEGPYSRTSQQTGGGDTCPKIAEIEAASQNDLAIGSNCSFLLQDSNGKCTVKGQESCPAGEGATHECKFNDDSSRVECKVTLGECTYDVMLVR